MPVPAPPEPVSPAPTALHPEQERPAEPPEAPEPPPPERPMEPPVPLPGSPPEPVPPLPPTPGPSSGTAAARRAFGSARLAAALLAASLLPLPGCTTPATTLRNPRTGQVVSCGGNVASSLAGGMVGHSIQKSADERCVAEHARLGFVPVR